MKLLDGKIVAEKIKKNIKRQVQELKKKNIIPCLAVILVGNDPASQLYVKIKEKTCREIGIGFKKYDFADNVKESTISNLISKLNCDKNISGIIVQLPLPKQFDTNNIISLISPVKDVDGLHPNNLGKLLLGESVVIPPTAAAILEILKSERINLQGKHLVLVGYGKLVGKPLAAMIATGQKDATLTICNKETKNLAFYTKQADILISAAGVPHLIKTPMIKKGAVVIDAGTTIIKSQKSKVKSQNYNSKIKNDQTDVYRLASDDYLLTANSYKLQARVVGDVDFANVKRIAGAITPPVGGIGPVTVAKLLENVVKMS